MSTAMPPPGAPMAGAPAEGPPADAAPAVVAVVVTRNPGSFLEECLAALGAQDYPGLSVLVVDAGSERDPTDRVAAALPGAFVRRLGGDPGFGGAANEALEAVQGATFFLVCHDDVALDPPAVRIMVEEAFRSNAAVVGPKLVDADDPSVLLEVGRSIDRLGGSHTGIEPGEVDQEQHDAVRDVFYVSSAAMLVRADLFDEFDGFDPDTFPGSEDLDLCWRARLAGARVVVAPDARARHYEAAGDRAAVDAPTPRDVARRRARVVLTCYSARTLLWVVPLALTVAFVEAVLFSVTSRRRAAFAGLGAWWWNLFHRRRYKAARKQAQAQRQIPDRELHELQVGAGASFGAFLAQHHADERMESIGDRGRDALETAGDALRHPATFAFVAFLALVLLGSRDLITQGVPEIGTLMPWPSVSSLIGELSSAWRHTDLGSTSAAPPALAFMAGLGTIFLGSTGLAQSLLVVAGFLVGSYGAFRLTRALDGTISAGAVSALVYGVIAVPRNDVANGRLGPLMLYALAPFLLTLLVRAAGFAGTTAGRRPLLGLVIVTAIATAWYPPAVLVSFAAALFFLLVAPLAHESAAALRALGAALVAAAGAALLLIPWTAIEADVGGDRAAWGVAFRPDLDLAQVLRFETGPNGGGIAAWGVLLAAAAALVLARGPRLAWAIRGWSLAILGYAAVYLPARLAPEVAVPAPEAGLAIAALGLAIAAGATAGAIGDLRGGRRIAWRRIVGAVAIAGLVVGVLGFVGDVFDGRWRASEGWGSTTLAFTSDLQGEGQFRILWLGDPSVLPTDPVEIDDALSYALTRNGPGDARALLRAPVTEDDAVIADAVTTALDGDTSRLGRILAPLGVRYVVLTDRNGEGGEVVDAPRGVARGLSDQLDLAELGSPTGLALYENLSWAPARALVPPPAADEVPTGDVSPLASSVGVDLSDAEPIHDAPVPPGQVLLAEAFDEGWSASSGGRDLGHAEAFGVVNSFPLEARGTVELAHDGQLQVYGLLLLELALWIIAVVWWSRGRRAVTRERHQAARVERHERTHRDFIDDLELLGDDVEFWEQA